MEKSLHKNLYSKRNIKPSYPKINRDIEPTSIEADLIEIDDLPLVTSGNDNTYKRYIISTVAVFGLIISFFISTNNLQNSDQSLVSEIVTESNIPLSSTTSTTLVVTSTSSSTTTSSTTTSLPIKVLSLQDAQNQLYKLGLYIGDIDGILGIETKNAIKEFQKLSGLVVDGILGPKTKSALEKGEDSYVSIGNQPISSTTSNSALDLRNYNPNAICIVGYVNDMQIWVPDPCFYPVFVFRYGQTAQVNSQAELDAYLNQNWSRTKEKTYNSLGEVSTQNYLPGINSPVNGLPMSPNSNNSIVIGIKNDNNVRARPQSGPQNADAVFEVLVEGGMTRFINIFYQSDISYHGPIRSARPTDPTVLRPLGGVLVASGATGGLIPEINDMGVPVITDRRPDYFRISSRKAPHNLYADTQKLKSTAISKGYKKVNTPQPLFPWGDPTFNNWQTNSFLTLPFSGYTETTWTWNGSTYLRTYYDAYQNQKYDNIHYWSDENGNTGQISFDTVIALFCEPYVHPLQLPSVKTVGEGRAILLHGGKMIDAKWKRGSNLDPFHIFDSNNNILYVPKGKVWISLVPNTKSPSFG